MPLLTESQALERLNCVSYKDIIVGEVDIRDEYVQIEGDSYGFAFSAKYGVVPKIGDVIRVYDRATYTRGIDINGEPVYFKTEKEMDEWHLDMKKELDDKHKQQFKENKKKLDEEYRNLPPVFKKRIRWFRKHNADFRWRFESYEMLCCTEAVKIAAKCATPEAVRDLMQSSWDFQKAFIPDLNEGHSGNSFGMSCRLAYNYLQDEEMVFFEHGALTPLVGCAEYGCAHPRPGIEKFAKERQWNE